MCKPLLNYIAQTKQRTKQWAGREGHKGSERSIEECTFHSDTQVLVVDCPYTVIYTSYTSNSPFLKISVYEKQNFLYVRP